MNMSVISAPSPTKVENNVDFKSDNRQQLAEGLARLLASTSMLRLKTQNFHWNVTGPLFYSLHGLFEKQYAEMIPATDAIAEQLRAIGRYAPGSFFDFASLSFLGEETGTPSANEMIITLQSDNETIAHYLETLVGVAQDAGSGVSEDLLVQRLAAHEKNVWMLRSMQS